MSSNDRIRRPDPERIGPIRNWSMLFRGPGGAPGEGDEPAPASGSDRPSSLNDVVARSVDLGYRVVDEYIRQGQKAAQRLNDRSYGAQTMAGDVQDLAMRLTQYASDFAGVWLQLVQLAAAGNASPVGSAGNGIQGRAPAQGPAPDRKADAGRSMPAAPPSAARTRVRVEVRSGQPTEVAVDLRPEAARLPLIVHALRAVEPDTPRLSDVSFEPGSDETAACLRIHVPPGQPPGIYNGLLIEEATSRPAGTVSVTITE